MSADIGPGDYVECVDAKPHPKSVRQAEGLVEGAVYRVKEIKLSPPGYLDAGMPGVLVEGVTLGLNEYGHPYQALSLSRFRPIYRPKSTLITDLLTKAPKDLEPA